MDFSLSPEIESYRTRIRAFVEKKRLEGWTAQQVKDALVADFGPSVLAAPPAAGIGLVAWLVPIGAVLVGVGIVIALALVWRRRRSPTPVTEALSTTVGMDARIDAELERLSDEDV